MSGRKRKNRTGVSIIAIIALLICGVLIYKTQSLEKELAAKTEEYKDGEAKLQSLKDENAVLEERARYIQTDKYIEELAREMGLVYQDEILFIPIESDDK